MNDLKLISWIRIRFTIKKPIPIESIRTATSTQNRINPDKKEEVCLYCSFKELFNCSLFILGYYIMIIKNIELHKLKNVIENHKGKVFLETLILTNPVTFGIFNE